MILLIQFILVCTICFVASEQEEQQTQTQTSSLYWNDAYFINFSYDTSMENGPNDWRDVNTDNSEYSMYTEDLHPIFDLDIGENACEKEYRPSPIALQISSNDRPCQDDHDIRTRRITNLDCTKNDMAFEITPHNLRAYYPLNDRNCRRPTIRIASPKDDDDAFVLAWMELHARSEHVVDGKRYDGELQMVHMGTANSDDQMATVSVLIEATADTDNMEFQFLLNQWQTIANKEKVRCDNDNDDRANTNNIRRLRESVHNRVNRNSIKRKQQQQQKQKHESLTSDDNQHRHRRTQAQVCEDEDDMVDCAPRTKMYPYTLWPSIHYFRYSGGLTTPPCTSIVNWRIIDLPMYISRRQFKQMASLLTSYQNEDCNFQSSSVLSSTGENFRPLQSRNKRRQFVSHCTSQNFNVSLYKPENQ